MSEKYNLDRTEQTVCELQPFTTYLALRTDIFYTTTLNNKLMKIPNFWN